MPRILIALYVACSFVTADVIVTSHEEIECEIVAVGEIHISALVPGRGTQLFPKHEVKQLQVTDAKRLDYLAKQLSGTGILFSLLSSRQTMERGRAPAFQPAGSFVATVNPGMLREAGENLRRARGLVFAGVGLQFVSGVLSVVMLPDTSLSPTTKLAVPIVLNVGALVCMLVGWHHVGEAGTVMRWAAESRR